MNATLLQKLRPFAPPELLGEIDAELADPESKVIQIIGEARWARCTVAQQLCLITYFSLRESGGVNPTLQEIADELRRSKTTVFLHLHELQRKGIIRGEKHKTGSIELIANH